MTEISPAFAPPKADQAGYGRVRSLTQLGRIMSWLALAALPRPCHPESLRAWAQAPLVSPPRSHNTATVKNHWGSHVAWLVCLGCVGGLLAGLAATLRIMVIVRQVGLVRKIVHGQASSTAGAD